MTVSYRFLLQKSSLFLPAPLANTSGVSGDATRPDNIVFDIIANPNGGTGFSPGGFGHPMCLNTTTNYKTLPVVSK
jgi:hypothetical protein